MMLLKGLILLALSVGASRASLTCAEGDTLIKTDFILTEEKSCSDLVAQISDFYNPVLRQECSRQLLSASVPDSVDQSFVFHCKPFTNGTVKYRSEVCCKGKPPGDGLTCFSCQDDPVQYDTQIGDRHTRHCNYYGEVKSCAEGEVCSVIMSYSEGDVYGTATKGCMPKAQCDGLEAQNADKCKSRPDATCAYCSECNYCNAEHQIKRISVSHVCTYPWTNPCWKRGDCVPNGDNYDDYVCKCYPGRFGPTCKESACDLTPCQNQGLCKATETEPFYECYCHNPWMGADCTESAPLCAVNNCKNGGTCYNAGGERCLCPEGFVGSLCELAGLGVCGPDTEKHGLEWNFNRWGDKYDCTSMINEALQERWQKTFVGPCAGQMRNEYNPGGVIYKPGVHGEFTVQQSVTLHTCEQSYGYTWATFLVCCASCFSNPCQNDGWCMQDSASDGFVCRCRLNYGGFLCENKLTSCFSAGDPHYFTFDGERYHFQGLCKYTMAENQCPDKLPPFKVLSRNEVRGTNTDVTYPKYVEVEVYDTVIRLDKDNVLRVDGADVTDQLPLRDPKGEGRFLVSRKGLELQLETDFGLVVSFDGNWLIKVQVPPEASGCVDGLCRTYDGDANNEYLLPDGTDVKDDPNGQSLLGNFFQVADPDDPECPARVQPNPPECDDATKADIDSDTYCGQIQNTAGFFASCIASTGQTAQMYMENCQYDVCAVSPDGKDAMKAAACASLKAFQAVCESFGFPANTEWRAATNCEPSCPGDLVFKASTTACIPSCDQPDYPEKCPFENTENCVCPDDTQVVTKDNKCIPAQDCGCRKEGRAIGDAWMNSDCTESYQCVECADCPRPVGTVTKSSHGCPEGEVCLTDLATGRTTCGTSEWECRPVDPDSGCTCIASPP